MRYILMEHYDNGWEWEDNYNCEKVVGDYSSIELAEKGLDAYIKAGVPFMKPTREVDEDGEVVEFVSEPVEKPVPVRKNWIRYFEQREYYETPSWGYYIKEQEEDQLVFEKKVH